MELPYIDNALLKYIPKWKNDVLNKDRDKVLIIDGREGGGKSTLATQLAAHLDPNFNIDKVAFNGDDFMEKIKDPSRKKGDCIILDEAFLAANSRSVMSSMNKAIVGLTTEMRQLNLFVIIVLPSFFDLDRTLGIWRSDILIHTYFDKRGNRGRYIVFNYAKKKLLHLKGKKFYSYGCVKTGLPAMRFNKGYTINELEYRKKKAEAFRLKKDFKKSDEKLMKDKVLLIKALQKQGLTYEKIGEELGIHSDSVKKLVYRWGVKSGLEEGTNINNISLNENNLTQTNGDN